MTAKNQNQEYDSNLGLKALKVFFKERFQRIDPNKRQGDNKTFFVWDPKKVPKGWFVEERMGVTKIHLPGQEYEFVEIIGSDELICNLSCIELMLYPCSKIDFERVTARGNTAIAYGEGYFVLLTRQKQ